MQLSLQSVFKMVITNGQMTNISEVKVAALVLVVAIAVVHRHHTRRVVHMEMVIHMHQIWAHCHLRRPVYSIQHQVSFIPVFNQ